MCQINETHTVCIDETETGLINTEWKISSNNLMLPSGGQFETSVFINVNGQSQFTNIYIFATRIFMRCLKKVINLHNV